MPELTYREAIGDALAQAMRRDPDVFLMGEGFSVDRGGVGVGRGLLAEFGSERVRETPISEGAVVGAGIGAALQGMRPVVEVTYQDFLTVTIDQLVNHAAKLRYMSGGQVSVPLTVRAPGGAGRGAGAQHGQQLEGWFCAVPGLKVVAPATPADMRGLLWSAIYDDNPVIVFEHHTLYGCVEELPVAIEPIPLGQARVHRAGDDVTVVAVGRLVHDALVAAEEAARNGISVEVLDPRTLLPLDEWAIVESVQRTGRCIVAHDAVGRMGIGAEIASVVQHGAFDSLDAPVERVGARFAPLPYAAVMENHVVPQVQDLLDAIYLSVGRRD